MLCAMVVRELLFYVLGTIGVLYSVMFMGADNPNSVMLLSAAMALLLQPIVSGVYEERPEEPEDLLTPLDHEWLGYHRYLGGPDA